jgi:hypothetical protein
MTNVPYGSTSEPMRRLRKVFVLFRDMHARGNQAGSSFLAEVTGASGYDGGAYPMRRKGV